jgi:hypothetical protein
MGFPSAQAARHLHAAGARIAVVAELACGCVAALARIGSDEWTIQIARGIPADPGDSLQTLGVFGGREAIAGVAIAQHSAGKPTRGELAVTLDRAARAALRRLSGACRRLAAFFTQLFPDTGSAEKACSAAKSTGISVATIQVLVSHAAIAACRSGCWANRAWQRNGTVPGRANVPGAAAVARSRCFGTRASTRRRDAGNAANGRNPGSANSANPTNSTSNSTTRTTGRTCGDRMVRLFPAAAGKSEGRAPEQD